MITVETSSTASFNCAVMKIIRLATTRQLQPPLHLKQQTTSLKNKICMKDKPPTSNAMKETGPAKIGDKLWYKNFCLITLLNVVCCPYSSSATSKGAHQWDMVAVPRVLRLRRHENKKGGLRISDRMEVSMVVFSTNLCFPPSNKSW